MSADTHAIEGLLLQREIEAFYTREAELLDDRRFDDWLATSVIAGDIDTLLNYRSSAPEPDRSHPYPAEHLLPLFVTLGAAGHHVHASQIHRGFMFAVLSMAALRFDSS